MAKNVPRVFAGGNALNYDISFWVGVVANAVFPLCQTIFILIENEKLYNYNKDVAGAISTCVVVSVAATGFNQVVSGIMLNWAIWRVQKTIKETNVNIGRFDIKMLLIHATSFILFLVSCIVSTTFSLIYWFNTNGTTLRN